MWLRVFCSGPQVTGGQDGTKAGTWGYPTCRLPGVDGALYGVPALQMSSAVRAGLPFNPQPPGAGRLSLPALCVFFQAPNHPQRCPPGDASPLKPKPQTGPQSILPSQGGGGWAVQLPPDEAAILEHRTRHICVS